MNLLEGKKEISRRSRQVCIWSGLATFAITGLLTSSACSTRDPYLIPLQPVTKERVSADSSSVNFNPKVDILFVIDDSYSMADKQKNLRANAQLFVDQISQNKFLDYHIGVVTSSVGYTGKKGGDGKLVGAAPHFVDRKTVDGLEILKENIMVGTAGDSTEKFFDPVQLALTSPLEDGYNRGFLRPDAHLAIIIVTDSDDQSYRVTSASNFYSFMVNALKGGDAKKVHPYAVYIPTTDATCNRSSEPEPDRIEELLKMSNGIGFDLCDPAFGVKLAGIGTDLAQKVGRTIYLNRAPDVSTIRMTYGTQTIENDANTGWAYDPSSNALILGNDIVWSTQPDGTSVQVDFTTATYD